MERSRKCCIFHGETFRWYAVIMFQPFIPAKASFYSRLLVLFPTLQQPCHENEKIYIIRIEQAYNNIVDYIVSTMLLYACSMHWNNIIECNLCTYMITNKRFSGEHYP